MDNSKNNNPLSALEKRLHFQSLLAELSAKFVRVPADTIDQEINDSLRRIAENLDIDHIGLGLITADSQDFYSKYSYAKPCTKPWLAESLMSEGPLLTQTLLAGKSFVMNDIDALPPEWSKEREGFLKYGIKADLLFPFIVGGRLTGGIGFASARPRQWSADLVQGLKLISDVFSNVLERKFAVQALQQREEQMRLAADAADIGLWVWNIPEDTIWATDRAREIYGLPIGDKLNMERFFQCLHSDDKERVRETLQLTLQGGHDFKEEYRVVHSDGSEHWICATGKYQLGTIEQPERLMGARSLSDFRQLTWLSGKIAT